MLYRWPPTGQRRGVILYKRSRVFINELQFAESSPEGQGEKNVELEKESLLCQRNSPGSSPPVRQDSKEEIRKRSDRIERRVGRKDNRTMLYERENSTTQDEGSRRPKGHTGGCPPHIRIAVGIT